MLKYIAAKTANIMIADAIAVALKAYKFYNLYTFATGVVNAIEGGGGATSAGFAEINRVRPGGI